MNELVAILTVAGLILVLVALRRARNDRMRACSVLEDAERELKKAREERAKAELVLEEARRARPSPNLWVDRNIGKWGRLGYRERRKFKPRLRRYRPRRLRRRRVVRTRHGVHIFLPFEERDFL